MSSSKIYTILTITSIVIAIIAIVISASLFKYVVDLHSKLSQIEVNVGKIESEVSKLTQMFIRVKPCIKIKYAKFFKVYCDGVAEILKDSLNRTILLLPRNVSKDVEQYFVAKYRPDLVLKVPVKRVILGSATQVALLWRLSKELNVNLFKYVVGIMWGKKYTWYIREVEELIKNGSIVDVGYIDAPDYEKIITLKPEVVIIYTIPGYEPSAKLLAKLNELKIPFIVDNEWMEKTILGRFEWIKFIALLFDIEDKASKVFDKVEKNILSLKNLTLMVRIKPKVAWFLIYRGYVWAPKPNSYVHDMINICGGKYLYENYSKVDLELVLELANETDVLVYSSYFVNTIDDILREEPRLRYLKAIRENRVYAYKPEIWQVGYAYTEKLVRDVCYIIHPELFKGHELIFFKQLK